MKLTVLAPGSRGDVQPYVALGLGLQRAGHEVLLATHVEFEALVCERGLGFAAVEGNPRRLIESETGQAWLASGRNPIAFVRHMAALAGPLMDKVIDDARRVCRGADAVLFSPVGFPGRDLAEAAGIPAYGVFLQPMSRTRAHPPVFWPTRANMGPLNYLAHLAQEQVIWRPLAPMANRARGELGLPPLRFGPYAAIHRETPLLYGYSEAVVPRPSDWPPRHHVTGYWFLDHPPEWQPPAEVVDFLADGLPPVYVGFGSMAPADAERLTAIAVEALARTNQRGILLGGWANLGRSGASDRVLVVESIPHDWLFPRVAAVVHHGGAGTTGAGLRAGRPTVVVPFFADQPFWGERVRALGAGPRPIQRRQLTADNLAAAIHRAVSDQRIRARAKALGERIRAEDGVGRAVELLDGMLCRSGR